MSGEQRPPDAAGEAAVLVKPSNLLTASSDDEIDEAILTLLTGRSRRHVYELARSLSEELEIPAQGYPLQYRNVTRPQLVSRLEQWLGRSRQRNSDPIAWSVVAVVLVTLCGLEESERLRTGQGPSDSSGCRRCSNVIDDDPGTARLLVDLYGSVDESDTDQLRRVVGDVPKLFFHRHGSTSLILRLEHENNAGGDVAALKLVLLPFLRVSTIGEATRQYAKTYAIRGNSLRPESTSALMKVYASGDGWILSSFHAGRTLAEWIAERNRHVRWRAHPISALRFRGDAIIDAPRNSNKSPGVQWRSENQLYLEDMLQITQAVLGALNQYQRASSFAANPALRPHCHGDLTPSNIIIERDGSNYHCIVVDYGINHLYAYLSSSGLEHDALYVAPEVRARAASKESTDYYSVAQIMIELLGVVPSSDGTVPDLLYVWHPSIARLLEDLLDMDPAFRGRLEGAGGGPLTTFISNNVEFEVGIARNSEEAPDFTSHGLSRTLFFFFSFSGELGRQTRVHSKLLERIGTGGSRLARLWQWGRCELTAAMTRVVRRRKDSAIDRQPTYAELRLRAATASYLWSWIWAGLLGLGFSIVLYYIGLDLGGFPMPVPYAVELLMAQTPFGSLVHFLALPQYVSGWQENWPARIVAATYALLAAKLYFNIYARLAPRTDIEEFQLSGWSGRAALWMRLMPPFNFVLVMIPTVVNAGLWPLATAIGQVGIAFGNLAVVGYLHRAYEVALTSPKDGSTAPVWSPPRANTQITGYDLISGWVVSSFLYAAVCVAVCIGIYAHALEDVWLYACIVGCVNFFLLFVKKCGIDGPRIRVAFARAEIAAERAKLRIAASGLEPRAETVGKASPPVTRDEASAQKVHN